VKLVGIDYLSIAPFEKGSDTHIELLKMNLIIIEGLNLADVSPGYYDLIALPILLIGADGAPARVLLIQK
jgi:arylformamidase